jgi:DNA mismatch repair protein MutS
MIGQFLAIKAEHPDALLFYRMGDFYELFFGDAETAAGVLGIALTRRGKHAGQDIPMCGVPVFAADEYLAKLIAAGFRVAVCEQIEDPAEARKRGAKAVVSRAVVRLVTPGTLTEDRHLSPGEANYLLAIGRAKGGRDAQLALAWIDISTGVFRVGATDARRLVSDVARVGPREVIVSDAAFADPELRPAWDALGRLVHPQPPSLFDSATAPERVARFFGVGTTDGFGAWSRPELSAIAAAIAYVEKTQGAAKPHLSAPSREEDGATLFIDAATRTSLELVRGSGGTREGSLIHAMDACVSGAGSRLLAERLCAPLTNPEAIGARLDAVAFFVADPTLGDAARAALKGMADLFRATARLSLDRGGPRDLGALREGFKAATEVERLFAGRLPPAELAHALAGLGGLPRALGARLDQALADDLPATRRDGGFVRAGFHPGLEAARALRDESRRVIAGMERALCAETGLRALKIRHNNVLGYFIEVAAVHGPALAGTEDLRQRFVHRQTMASAMRFSTAELSALETRIGQAAEEALAAENAVFEDLRAEAVAQAEAIRRAAEALAVIDVSASLAHRARNENWRRPDVDMSFAFRIEGGRHPVVERALRGTASPAFVANDCDLSPPDAKEGATQEAGAVWLVTGPNMGGKSTFLRQNALIVVMAQAGSFVPARAAHLGVVDRLFSRVGASDDLARGRSTFMVEMVETAAILNQAGPRALVILDEIGRGTATFDGLSIAWAAVEHLHEKNRSRALFATHFHELTALEGRLARLANVTMRVKEWQGEAVFLHEVAKGAADRSYGIAVARLAGLPPPVVARAKQVLARLEAGEGAGAKAGLLDDLPLFRAMARAVPTPADAPDPLREALKAIDCDELTPREALESLYRLKGMVGEGS